MRILFWVLVTLFVFFAFFSAAVYGVGMVMTLFLPFSAVSLGCGAGVAVIRWRLGDRLGREERAIGTAVAVLTAIGAVALSIARTLD